MYILTQNAAGISLSQINDVVTNQDGTTSAAVCPVGSVQISAQDYSDLSNGVKTWNGTAAVIPALTLAQAQAAQTQVILDAAQTALSAMTAAYPADEPLTWALQYAEAVAYTANSTANTPTLAAIATAAGITVPALAAKVLLKSQAYQSAAGAIVGKRQLRCAQIAAATSVAQAQGVVW